MTLPTSDAQPSRFLPRRPQIIPPTHSMPVTPSVPPPATFPLTPPPTADSTHHKKTTHHEHAIDFATNSLDLATGGFKTLTAKRELPTRSDQRASEVVPDLAAATRSYLLAVVILVCVVLMLIGGGVVLFVMLQP